MLDGLAATSSGTDGMPHWFIRIAAPSICSPITHLFNLSLTTSIVPTQWKTSAITPVPKTKQPTQMQRLWANLRHSHSLAPARKNCCPQLHLPNLDTPSYTSPFPRSVCLPANWVNYISNHPSHPPSVSSSTGAPVCPRHCLRLF